MKIQFTSRVTIYTPASKTWHIIAHQYAEVGAWASSIPTSRAVEGVPLQPELEVCARACSTAVPGFAEVQERLTAYDELGMTYTYVATQGLPVFVRHAENTWSVQALGPDQCLVEARTMVHVALVPGVLVLPLMKVQLKRLVTQVFEELKYYAENDRVHPRKLKALRSQTHRGAAARPGVEPLAANQRKVE